MKRIRLEITNLPEEILEHIFVKLRVKTLVGLRCVCKTWQNLIKNPYFGEKYCTINYSNHNHALLRKLLRNKAFEDVLLTLDSQTVRSSHPVKLPVDQYDIVQSCNGILCYGNREISDLCHLYNPSTEEHLTLPPGLFKPKKDYNHYYNIFGFGFDTSSRDYKIVRIWNNGRFAEIYKLSTNRWSKLDMAKRGDFVSFGVCLNNVYHWRLLHLRSESSVKQLLTFDYKDEKFGHMECPRDCEIGLLSVLDESLAFCSKLIGRTEIWIMKEYGKTESWTKMYSIDLLSFGIKSVLTCWIHDMNLVLLGDTGKLITCKKDNTRSVIFDLDCYRVTRGVVFRPSLFSLRSRRLIIGEN